MFIEMIQPLRKVDTSTRRATPRINSPIDSKRDMYHDEGGRIERRERTSRRCYKMSESWGIFSTLASSTTAKSKTILALALSSVQLTARMTGEQHDKHMQAY